MSPQRSLRRVVTDIFISYSRQDEATARQFAGALAAQGFSLWWDDTLQPGQTYDQTIENALRQAKAVVVLWSRTACASRWVRSEATMADRLGTLVPVMIEECERPVQFELTQSANLIGWHGDAADPRFGAFADHVRRLIAGDVVSVPASEPVGLVRTSRQALPTKPSVAILPLTTLSGVGNESYLADGLVEEISTLLSRFSGLFVIAGQSSLAYRGTTRTPMEIAAELGVRYLLGGSVRSAGGRVRVSVRLDEAATGQQIWAERFDDRLEDLFDLQDRIASAVAGGIDQRLRDAEVVRAATSRPSSPTAYDLYLQACARLREYRRDAMHAALALAEQALTIDPDYAWARITAAQCHGMIFMHRWDDDLERHRVAAQQNADRAVRLGANDEMVLAVAAGVQMNIYGDFALASQLAERSLGINSESYIGNYWAGWSDLEAGRVERALERLQKALRLNPASSNRTMNAIGIAQALFFLGRDAEAAAILAEAAHIVPEYTAARAVLIAALARLGRISEGRSHAAALAPEHQLKDTLRYFSNRGQRQELKAAFALLETP